MNTAPDPLPIRGLAIGAAAMAVIVTASNFLVQYAINDWLTYAAFTYPVSFLVTDLCNRAMGPKNARRVVYVGFAAAVILSAVLATPRIAIASGSAFLIAQVVDVQIFHRLRTMPRWWMPPLVSSAVASALDTLLFFSIAFVGTGVPWITLALGDYVVKAAMAVAMLVPFGIALRARLVPASS